MRCLLFGIYIYLIGILALTHTQFLALGARSQKAPNSCDSSKTALVEQFFNVIFNEFHNTPPVCVCVQMCPEHPTYCYPNGCLKKSVEKRVVQDTPIAKVSENTKPLMLFMDEKKDFIGDILGNLGNHVDETKLLRNEKTFIKNLRPDPFKDRYKMLVRYKKMPRVDIRYHHGEHMKHMKLDNTIKIENADVSNTRWPTNKNRRSSKRIYIDEQSEKKTGSNTKFHIPMFKDGSNPSYSSKYFKRDLRNITDEPNEDKDRVDIEAIYVMDTTDTNKTEFSIRTLIDDIIENSMEYKAIPVDTTTDYYDHAKQMSSNPPIPIEKAVQDNVTLPVNETTNIISINFTNENDDKNMYLEGDGRENDAQNYSGMIATLSKKIDMQNNTSLEMMRQALGNIEMDITTTDKYFDDTTKTVTTENPTTSIDYEVKVTKKNKQRLGRKLQKSKTN